MKFLSIQDIVITLIGCIVLVMWLLLLLRSNKNNGLFKDLDEKEYPLKDLYSTGYTFMEMLSYKYTSNFDRKLRTDLSVMYDEKYVEYYLRVVYAQSVTFGLLLFVLSFALYGLARDIMILVICFVFAGLAVYYFLTLAEKKIQKRSDELLNDFSEIVSKLALLINAGMIMREAWEEVAYASEGTIYKEMRLACDDMKNGISESEAIRRFGMRCIVPEIKKFSSTVIQGIEKGNSELSMMLQDQSDDVWNMKKQRVARAGAKANTKLMMPMMIMFIGILIMVVVPIFTNMGV